MTFVSRHFWGGPIFVWSVSFFRLGNHDFSGASVLDARMGGVSLSVVLRA